ncbi:uroporphyrinogen-III C-methyltransferase, partial [Enterobacter hormaechei subsp. steigerwaltii]
SAVTAYAGIPLTHRDYAQSVTFVTVNYNAVITPFDCSDLSQSRQTLAIYMGTMKADDISEQLIQHGRDATTPVAVISRGTRVVQHVAIGTLQDLATLAKDAPLPAL